MPTVSSPTSTSVIVCVLKSPRNAFVGIGVYRILVPITIPMAFETYDMFVT